MISRILPSLRMVGHGIGFRVAVARLSSSVASPVSFDRVSSADLENGDGRIQNHGILLQERGFSFQGGKGGAHHV